MVPGDENALISASAEGHLEVMRLLLSRGADVQARSDWDGERRTALSMAEKNGHREAADLLRSAGAVE